MDNIDIEQNLEKDDLQTQKILEKLKLKNISSSIGFAIVLQLFLSAVLMSILEVLSNGINYDYMSVLPTITSPVLYYTLGSIFFILSVFTPFYFIARSLKINLSTVLPFKPVNKKILLGFIGTGLGVCICSNYLTDLFISNLNQVGIYPILTDSQAESDPLAFFMLIIYSALIPAFIEEFAFRGVCLGLFRKFGDGFAIIMSSILFSLIHCNLQQIPFAFLVGLTLSYVAVELNSLLPCIIIHFINNLYSIIMDELAAYMNSYLFSIIDDLIPIIFIIIGIFSLIYLLNKNSNLLTINKSDSLLSLKEKVNYSTCNIGMICAFTLLFFIILASVIS